MRKTAIRLFAALLLFCALFHPLSAAAAGVDVNRECFLELEYSSEGIGFSDQNIQIFRIAQMYPNGDCILLPPFSSLPVKITGVTSQMEWRDTADTLAAYIVSQHLSPTASGLPIYTHLLAICHRSYQKTWPFQRFMACYQTHMSLSSMGRQWI